MRYDIVLWFREKLIGCFNNGKVLVWLIGSVASGKEIPNDCDILIIFDTVYMDELLDCSESWRQDFKATFNLELHLTRISFEEVRDWLPFLKRNFKKPHLLIYPFKKSTE